ncbi:hypothetical protein BBJ28_00005641 [Nothophytophthora sp. Chile5]|nr:hypothetical protein BBJ28_00005641 [Nothophytophthora sp. Chile5]
MNTRSMARGQQEQLSIATVAHKHGDSLPPPLSGEQQGSAVDVFVEFEHSVEQSDGQHESGQEGKAAAVESEKEALDAVEDITKHLNKISFGGSLGKVAKITTSVALKAQLPSICNEVFTVLGPYNLEATYQRALAMELRARGVRVTSEVEIPICYKGQRIATRRLDLHLQLDKPVILELKAVTTKLTSTHLKQLEFYLTHFDVSEGYLINFPHVTGFPDDNGVVYGQEVLQPEGGAGVSDRVTRSSTPRKDALPEVIHVHKVAALA